MEQQRFEGAGMVPRTARGRCSIVGHALLRVTSLTAMIAAGWCVPACNLEEGWVLRPTVAIGLSLQSNQSFSSQLDVMGASPLNGSITTTTTVPRALGRMNAGVQVYRAGGFDFRLEYDLMGSTNYLGQSGYFKAAYHF